MFKYVVLTLKHKYFVFLAGLKTKANIIDLILHDISKFSPKELPHYGRQFFGKADDSVGFAKAWNHHQNSNPHHWEYWIPRTGHNRGTPVWPSNTPLPMPERVVREMIADWLGASRVYDGKWPDVNNWPWLERSRRIMVMHSETQKLVDKVLGELCQ